MGIVLFGSLAWWFFPVRTGRFAGARYWYTGEVSHTVPERAGLQRLLCMLLSKLNCFSFYHRCLISHRRI